jgi:hypothetical protein
MKNLIESARKMAKIRQETKFLGTSYEEKFYYFLGWIQGILNSQKRTRESWLNKTPENRDEGNAQRRRRSCGHIGKGTTNIEECCCAIEGWIEYCQSEIERYQENPESEYFQDFKEGIFYDLITGSSYHRSSSSIIGEVDMILAMHEENPYTWDGWKNYPALVSDFRFGKY